MTFKEQLTLDQDVFFNTDEFAEDAVYMDSGGKEYPAKVIPEFGKTLGLGLNTGADADDIFRPGLGDYAVFYLDPRGIPGLPVYQDTLTLDGETWTIQQAQNDSACYICFCSKDERWMP